MKKTAIWLVTLLLLLSPTLFARAAGEIQYVAGADPTEPVITYTEYTGEKVHFSLTTPKTAVSVKLYLDGKKQSAVVVFKEENATSKIWTADLTMENAGTRRVRFYVYGQDGKIMARYPAAPIRIQVKLRVMPPVTEDALIMEHDMAVLKGTLAPATGVKYRSFGFYLGTSQTSMKKLAANKARGTAFNRLASGLKPRTTYYYRAYAVASTGVIVSGAVKYFTTPAKTAWSAETSRKATSDAKYDYLFHSQHRYYTIDDPPLGYNTKAEAAKHMTTIRVPVWKLTNGKRAASSRTLTVNRKLAANVKAIFSEIYALDMRFPIHQLYGYSYRKVTGPGAVHTSRIMSHHSFGAAIDINWSVNRFYLDGDQRNTKSPYCIPQAVIDIFAKYGWAWGGDFACGQDTMHFQYLGVELLP